MRNLFSRLQRVLGELRRRRVFRVAAAYAVVALVCLELIDALFPALLLPDWAGTFVAVLLIVGFPVAIILAWAYDVTPEGVRRTAGEARTGVAADASTEDSARSDGSRAGLGDDAAGRSSGDSIAVLPFANLSGEDENDYLSDGIAEELINALNQVEGLRVASRGSCFQFKGKAVDAREIGRQLGVHTVLEGSVRRGGDRLRVNVQLASARDGFDIWSGSYDRRLTDIFEMQDEISRAIIEALRVELPGGASTALVSPSTAHITAYEFYLRGRQFFHERSKKSFRFAREMFQRAIAIDPEYALAHAGLADCSSFLAHWYQDEEEAANIDTAAHASRRAIELAPELGQTHASRGFALFVGGRLEEATKEFEKAVQLDPGQFDARYFHARASYHLGDLARAVELFEQAASVREDPEARYFAAQSYSALGRTEEAEAAYRRALQVIERHLELHPDDARTWTMGAVSHSRLGHREQGLRFAERALEVDPEDSAVCYNVACLYALEGEADRALACLEETVRDRRFAHPEWIAHDPDLDPLRDHPRFQQLLDRDG